MNVCVYLSSSDELSGNYNQLARDTGRRLGEAGCRLVFGGANCGMMGILAEASAEAGAHVIGVYPGYFKNLAHEALVDHVIADDIRQRKQYMQDHGDAFVILPGGLGTLDECFDIIAAKALKEHDKPIIILNYEGFYDELHSLLDKLYREKFIRNGQHELWQFVDNLDELIVEIEALSSND